MPPVPTFSEASARDVLLLRAFESEGDSPLWTREDRDWATRLARPAGAADFIAERARHAMQRLAPREPGVARLRASVARRWGWGWAAAVVLAAFVAGAAIDHLGSAQRINLLAPPVWALVLWNLGMAALFVGWRVARSIGAAAARPGWMQRWWLARAPAGVVPIGPLRHFAADWAHASAPLFAARAALLLHLAAAALALGLTAGLYLRGLALDYRAGWQSTFLDAPAVQSVLDTALAPARIVTGIEVPKVATLRVGPGEPSSGPAAPWLHLYAATLAIFVMLPRGLLAALAAWRVRRGGRNFALPLHEPYFQRLAMSFDERAAIVIVQPLGYSPAPPAALALRDELARDWGEQLQLLWQTTVAPDDDAAIAEPPRAALRVALFDMAATPEAEVQGRWLSARAGGAVPLEIVVDGFAFAERFAAMPERWPQRRRLWLDFAAQLGLPCRFIPARAD